jgi:geranylgeranyl diphosphate synthase type II
MAQEGKATPRPLLERMYQGKTGALLGAAAGIGCILAGASAPERQAAVAYAHHLGFAFQLTDDILDVQGEEALLGKPVGSDAANGKTTWVSLYGLAAARREAERLTEEAKKDLDKLPGDTRFLKGLADVLIRRQS